MKDLFLPALDPPSPRRLHSADELGALRQDLLGDPLACAGRDHHAVVRIGASRVFLRDRLPPGILDDPGMWEERKTRTVTLTRLRDSALSQPVAARPARIAAPEDDDGFEVIQPF